MKNFQNKAKIVKVSKSLRAILLAGLVLEIASQFGVLAVFIIPIIKRTIYPIQTYFVCWTTMLTLFLFVITLKLFRFFDRLKNGHLFDAQTVGYLDEAGKWWIVSWLFEGLFQVGRNQMFQIAPTWGFGSLFAGLALIFVAWLLKEAQGLQEEQELTV